MTRYRWLVRYCVAVPVRPEPAEDPIQVRYIGLLRPAAPISHTHVSRLRTRALGYLCSRLLDPQEHAPCHRGIPPATEQ